MSKDDLFLYGFGLRLLLSACIAFTYMWAQSNGFELWVVTVLVTYACFRGFNLHEKEEVLVGVVTPRDDLFDEWVRQNKVPGEQYVQVSKEEDLGGFDRIEPGFLWETLGNLYFKARKDVRN